MFYFSLKKQKSPSTRSENIHFFVFVRKNQNQIANQTVHNNINSKPERLKESAGERGEGKE